MSRAKFVHVFNVAPGHVQRTIPLEKGRSYRLLVTGWCQFLGAGNNQSCAVDAAWFWGPCRVSDWNSKRFWPKDCRPHNLLTIEGAEARTRTDWQGDYNRHEYSCILVGNGNPVNVCLARDFISKEESERWYGRGSIDVKVQSLPSEVEVAEVARLEQKSERERKRLSALELIKAKKELAEIEHRRLLLEKEARDAEAREREAERRAADDRERASLALATARVQEQIQARTLAAALAQKKEERIAKIRARREAIRLEAAAAKAREEAESRRVAQMRAESEQKEMAARLKEEAEVTRRISHLQRTVRKGRNFLDPTFREAYVRRHFEDILNVHRAAWEREYDCLLENPEFAARVRSTAPEVIEWHEARLEMALSAELMALSPETEQTVPEPQTQSYYEQLIDRINAGEKVSAEPLQEYAQDLFREKKILAVRRRNAIKANDLEQSQHLDAQLADVRRRLVEIGDAVKKSGGAIEIEDSSWSTRSLEARFLADYYGEQRLIGVLKAKGDERAIQVVENLYAERRAKSFQVDTDTYT